ncbi:hypothetical protein M7I_7429 [Glarea lozoyensis 74030]|uniref:Uncharacterized protein n=1 Tax=Glarea lozoyensis (strain ATCC 74030 / MF5533) TaxID=1104152 RepID=H0EX98_GLAL7|nr:hypothetical protein M7I_7429 [Glarea lozoyensis 74030]
MYQYQQKVGSSSKNPQFEAPLPDPYEVKMRFLEARRQQRAAARMAELAANPLQTAKPPKKPPYTMTPVPTPITALHMSRPEVVITTPTKRSMTPRPNTSQDIDSDSMDPRCRESHIRVEATFIPHPTFKASPQKSFHPIDSVSSLLTPPLLSSEFEAQDKPSSSTTKSSPTRSAAKMAPGAPKKPKQASVKVDSGRRLNRQDLFTHDTSPEDIAKLYHDGERDELTTDMFGVAGDLVSSYDKEKHNLFSKDEDQKKQTQQPTKHGKNDSGTKPDPKPVAQTLKELQRTKTANLKRKYEVEPVSRMSSVSETDDEDIEPEPKRRCQKGIMLNERVTEKVNEKVKVKSGLDKKSKPKTYTRKVKMLSQLSPYDKPKANENPQISDAKGKGKEKAQEPKAATKAGKKRRIDLAGSIVSTEVPAFKRPRPNPSSPHPSSTSSPRHTQKSKYERRSPSKEAQKIMSDLYDASLESRSSPSHSHAQHRSSPSKSSPQLTRSIFHTHLTTFEHEEQDDNTAERERKGVSKPKKPAMNAHSYSNAAERELERKGEVSKAKREKFRRDVGRIGRMEFFGREDVGTMGKEEVEGVFEGAGFCV